MHFISSRVESVEVEKPDGSVVTYPVGFIKTQVDFYSATGKTVGLISAALLALPERGERAHFPNSGW